MADMLADGNVVAAWVPTSADIADKTAPTVAELTDAAVVRLECSILADGLGISTEEGVVDVPKLCETSRSQSPGRFTDSIELTLARKAVGETDDAYDVLVRSATGFLVVREGIAVGTAFAAAQEVHVFPTQVGVRRFMPPEENSVIKYMHALYVTEEAARDATVAA